jgi:hypothetical protein
LPWRLSEGTLKECAVADLVEVNAVVMAEKYGDTSELIGLVFECLKSARIITYEPALVLIKSLLIGEPLLPNGRHGRSKFEKENRDRLICIVAEYVYADLIGQGVTKANSRRKTASLTVNKLQAAGFEVNEKMVRRAIDDKRRAVAARIKERAAN